MRQRSQCFSWVVLTSALTISGCFSSGTYVMERGPYEEAMASTAESRHRTAVPARASDTGKQVWLTGDSLERATVLSTSGRWMQLEARSPEYASPVGAVLLAAGIPLIARGSVLMANNRDDHAAWVLGADGPGALLGLGIAGALSGAALVILGRTIAWQEIKPHKSGWTYLSSPSPSPSDSQ